MTLMRLIAIQYFHRLTALDETLAELCRIKQSLTSQSLSQPRLVFPCLFSYLPAPLKSAGLVETPAACPATEQTVSGSSPARRKVSRKCFGPPPGQREQMSSVSICWMAVGVRRLDGTLRLSPVGREEISL